MGKDLKNYLWLLKLGAVVNFCFLGRTLTPPLASVDAHVLIPAQILFAVSAFRCLFPVRYKDNIVFHDSPLSSIFLTRLFATFSEVALIYQLAYVIRLLNIKQVGWVDALSWMIVAQVLVSQIFVWDSILSGRRKFFFYEELGWAVIYAVNTIVSLYLYMTVDNLGGREILLQVNLLFGIVYLPWQFIHLRVLWRDTCEEKSPGSVTGEMLKRGLDRSIRVKNQTSDSKAWGGSVGVIWMTAYWATLIPMWSFLIIQVI